MTRQLRGGAVASSVALTAVLILAQGCGGGDSATGAQAGGATGGGAGLTAGGAAGQAGAGAVGGEGGSGGGAAGAPLGGSGGVGGVDAAGGGAGAGGIAVGGGGATGGASGSVGSGAVSGAGGIGGAGGMGGTSNVAGSAGAGGVGNAGNVGGAAGAGGALVCDALTECGGECVDLQSDERFCGDCLTACGSHETCVGGACSSPGGLVISELHMRPPSSQFVELFNGSASVVSLQGGELRFRVENTTRVVALPVRQLAPGQLLAVSTPDLTWNDGGAVWLLDAEDNALDFVRVGESAVPVPAGASWSGANAANPSWVVGQSLVRDLTSADTDSAADWRLHDEPSAGTRCPRERCGDSCVDTQASRQHCGGCDSSCSGGQVCVSGFCQDTDAIEPWISEYRRSNRAGVEIHNPSASARILTGYTLLVEADGATFTYSFDSAPLPSGGFRFVVMGAGDDDDTLRFGGSSSAFRADVAISLFEPGGAAVDFLRLGSSSTPPPTGTTWNGPAVPAPSPAVDESVQRDLTRPDTDSSADWVVAQPATPGHLCGPERQWCDSRCTVVASDPLHCGGCSKACSAQESCVDGACVSVGKVVISAFEQGSIYLYNGGDSEVSIGNWKLDWRGPEPASFALPIGRRLGPGKYIELAEGNCGNPGNKVCTRLDMKFIQGAAITLRDATGVVVDYVTAGQQHGPIPTGASWTGPTISWSNTLESVLRDIWSPDTDTSADWSAVAVAPFPYAQGCQTTVCAGQCLDATTSDDHCGGCGVACMDHQACIDSTCRDRAALWLDAVEPADDGASSGRLTVFDGANWRNVTSTSPHSPEAFAVRACEALGFSSGTVISASSAQCSGCFPAGGGSCSLLPNTPQRCLFDVSDTGPTAARVRCSDD